MDESTLPEPLRKAIAILRERRMSGARVDAVDGNFAYVWLPAIRFDPTKYPQPHERPVWIRVPLQFPVANPHGMVTANPLNPIQDHPIKGASTDAGMCAPVSSLGAHNYYSWTWSGEIGPGPALNSPEDILEVVTWYERRIRIA